MIVDIAFSINIFTLICVHVCVRTRVHICVDTIVVMRRSKDNCEVQFSPSIVRVPETEIKTSGLAADGKAPLPSGPSH